MKSNATFCTRHESENRGEAREEFHVYDSIDPNTSRLENGAKRTGGERHGVRDWDRNHIFLGNDFHRVEDESVVFEYHEVNIFPSDQSDCVTDCGIRKNGRSLFGEFDEENAATLVRL